MASVTFLCPACAARIEARELAAGCPGCGARVPLGAGGGFEAGAPLTACAVCGSQALYVAKDFNKNFGLVVVALGSLGFLWGAFTGFAALLGLTVLDRVVYYLRPLVTVCYACKAVYRGVAPNPLHAGYELTYDETFEGTGTPPRVGGPAGPPHSP